eukprot:TRINITY_DN17089_c0_g1_i2.p1 TRINITY_DN17089_c0_g1~~TRINITY_DN17089_c0_g1_i2.p1  ORF type:complete len:131 (+),score=22.57 TRINITY_DN17089_c0_g1_i2:37-393(+)
MSEDAKDEVKTSSEGMERQETGESKQVEPEQEPVGDRDKRSPHIEMLPGPYRRRARQQRQCGSCHIPYPRKTTPFHMTLVVCGVCHKKFVPELILATVKIGRAVQQECRDRSRMPSSA